MYTLIGGLASCEYEIAKFSEILDEVQKLVDNLNLHSYTNLTRWVNDLDLKVTAGVICTCTVHVLYYTYYKGLGEINYFKFLRFEAYI